MRYYQMDQDAVASQLNSDLTSGLDIADSSHESQRGMCGVSILREICSMLRSKLYFVDFITVVGYAVSIIFSLLNKNYGLLWLTLGCLFFSVLFILLQVYFLAAYKTGYYARINKTNQGVAVIRNGEAVEIPSNALTPGDLLVLKKGNILYADARVVSCENLFADESLVFGSTIPAEKIADSVQESNLPPEKQRNMLWKGSFVSGGTGHALVVATEKDCYLAKTGGRKTKKQHSFFYNMQNNIGRIISYLYVIMLGLSMMISVVFSNRYVEAFLIVAVLSSLIALDPVSCLIEWCYYRMAKKLNSRGILVRNIEAFDRMNKEKELYYDSSSLVLQAPSYSQVIPFTGDERSALSYFSLCVGNGTLCDAISGKLKEYELDHAQLDQEFPVFRREIAEDGNVFSLFSKNGTSVALATGYWKSMLPFLSKKIEDETLERIAELERHGKPVYLLATYSMDFIPTKLDSAVLLGKMSAYAMVVFEAVVQTDIAEQITQLHRGKMNITLVNRFSAELGEYLAKSYDMNGICESTPEEASYSLIREGERNPIVFADATPIEREQAMVVIHKQASPQQLIYDVKCMFCGIRRCLNFLVSTMLYIILGSLIMFLRGDPVRNVVIPALLITPALVCICYYLLETVRNCNQHLRSLILGALCGSVGVLAALVGLNMPPFVYVFSVFLLAGYLFAARKPFAFSVKDGALLGSCLLVAVLPWLFLGGNWIPCIILALYPALSAFVLDRFY